MNLIETVFSMFAALLTLPSAGDAHTWYAPIAFKAGWPAKCILFVKLFVMNSISTQPCVKSIVLYNRALRPGCDAVYIKAAVVVTVGQCCDLVIQLLNIYD